MPLPPTGYALADISPPSSALTDFTVIVDLSRLPQSWWDAVDTADATKGRAAKDGGTELACDWLSFDSGAQTGWLRVLWTGTLATSGTHTLRIYPPQAANASYAPGDTYGQHAAYDANWAGYWPDGGGNDRTANANHGTAQGGVTVGGATGQVGAATALDGVDDYVSMSGEVTDEMSDLTVMVWTRPDAGGRVQTITSIGDPGISNAWTSLFLHSDDTVRFESFGGGGAAYSTVPATVGAWNHVVGRLYASEYRWQALLHGGSLGVKQGKPPTITYAEVWMGALARDGTLLPADATIDEAQIHATARSDAWIAHEYAQTSDQAAFWGTWTWEDEGGSAEPETITLGLATAAAEGYALSIDRAAADRSLGFSAATAAGWPMEVARAKQERALGFNAAPALGYAFEVRRAVRETQLGYGAATATGYALTVDPASQARTLGFASASTSGWPLSVTQGAPGTESVLLGFSQAPVSGWPLSVSREPASRSLGFAAATAFGYGFSVQRGVAAVSLSIGAAEARGWPIAITASNTLPHPTTLGVTIEDIYTLGVTIEDIYTLAAIIED